MQDGPSLTTSEGRLLASGKDQIREKIEAMNDGVRNDGHQVRSSNAFITKINECCISALLTLGCIVF